MIGSAKDAGRLPSHDLSEGGNELAGRSVEDLVEEIGRLAVIPEENSSSFDDPFLSDLDVLLLFFDADHLLGTVIESSFQHSAGAAETIKQHAAVR